MYFGYLLLAIVLAVEARNIPQHVHSLKARGVQSKVFAPAAFKEASALTTSTNVLTLRSTKTATSHLRSAAFLLGHVTMPVGNSTSLISLFEGEEFATDVTFGTQTFEFIVDTGSSDTWVVETGFDCVDVETSDPEPESYCDFGPTYTVDSSFVEIPDENFNITYGDGEFLTGILGWENVTVAGITVNQTVALVNYAAWDGDNTTSGLIGLAYPGLTSAYAGTDPSKDQTQLVYNPIFTTMYEEGLVSPLFSLVIERNLSGPAGYLALGGVPPVDFVQDFTSTPILITEIQGYPDTYDFYTIEIDSIVLDNVSIPSSGGDIQYIVDSGTTLNYYPTAVADAVNAAFIPPATYSEDEFAYIVDCTATPPGMGIQINGTTFWTNPLDMILIAGTDEEGNDVCISGVDDGGSLDEGNVFILGDTFLKNVVAVFDVGAVELSFAAREYYPSDDNYKKT